MAAVIVPVEHGQISVDDRGKGPALVFLHGLLVDGSLWQPVVDELSDAYRCVSIDLPLGSHRIAMHPDADLSPPALARIVHAVVRQLDLSDITLVGLDTGGAVAQIALSQDASRIARLILADCDCYERFPPALVAPFKALAFVPPLAHVVLRNAHRRPLRDLIVMLVTKTRDVERERRWLGPMARDAGCRRDAIKVLRGVHKRHTLQAVPALRAFDRPALVLWGAGDLLFPRRDAHRLVADLANARLRIIEDSRTFIPIDNPRATAHEIRAFLADTDGQVGVRPA